MRKGVRLKTLFALAVLVIAVQAQAHDLYEIWNSNVTPTACLVGSESGINILTERMNDSEHDLSARIYIGSLHPGAENPFERISDLNPNPYFLYMQIITSSQIRMNEIKVSNVFIELGDISAAPIADPEREHDGLPVVFLGGTEAKRFLDLLEAGDAPIVSVTLGDSETFQIPVSKNGFRVARAMMDTCMKQVRNFTLD